MREMLHANLWRRCSLNIALTIFWGIIVLVILVIVHEAGHFIAAKAFGVRVTEFMIGLPGPNIGFKYKGTKFGITAIPLGGYNRITGMEAGKENPHLQSVLAYVYRQGSADVEHTACACGISEDEAREALIILDGWGSINAPKRDNKTDKYAAPKVGEYALGQPREVKDEKALLDSERKETYRGLSVWKRLVTLFAGPLLNIVLALILFIVLFCCIGVQMASNNISSVAQGGAAQEAGLQAGDVITKIDNHKVDDWESLKSACSGLSVGQSIVVEYERDGVAASATLTLKDDGNGNAQLGVYSGVKTVRSGIGEALQTSWQFFTLTIGSYASLFNPSTATETISQSSSVVGIAAVAKQAADNGLSSLLYIIAVISLSLGIVNLLPFPPLDGGKIVVEVVQKIIRREIPEKVISITTTVVIALFLLLFVVLVRQDILRFFMGG